MLEVQKYLLEHKNFDKLTEDFGIKVNRHPNQNLVILNYCQIDSHKHKLNPVVRECRGLVLNSNYDVVAKSFYRFFNLGEDDTTDSVFNWNNFVCNEKVDGSAINLFYYNNRWNINTRNSWGNGQIHPDFNYTWAELCFGLLKEYGVNLDKLSLFNTYVFEFCSKYNKVVRHYPTPTLYHLTTFDNKTCEEIDYKIEGVLTPDIYKFNSIDEILGWLKLNSDKTFEGFVIRDCDGQRIKIKNIEYLRLHKLRGENPANCKKNLLPFIFRGCDETDELLQYFDEFKQLYHDVNKEFGELYEFWDKVKGIQNQKDFAFAVDNRRLRGILFMARQKGVHPSEVVKDVKQENYLLKAFL